MKLTKIPNSQFSRKSRCFTSRDSVVAANADSWKRNIFDWVNRVEQRRDKRVEDETFVRSRYEVIQGASTEHMDAEPHQPAMEL